MNTIAKNTFIAMVSLVLFYFIFLESNSFYLSSMSSFSLESTRRKVFGGMNDSDSEGGPEARPRNRRFREWKGAPLSFWSTKTEWKKREPHEPE